MCTANNDSIDCLHLGDGARQYAPVSAHTHTPPPVQQAARRRRGAYAPSKRRRCLVAPRRLDASSTHCHRSVRQFVSSRPPPSTPGFGVTVRGVWCVCVYVFRSRVNALVFVFANFEAALRRFMHKTSARLKYARFGSCRAAAVARPLADCILAAAHK